MSSSRPRRARRETYNKVLKVTEKVGKIGWSFPSAKSDIRHLNPIEAVGYGFSATGDALGATLNVMRRLVTGKDGLDKLSGPIEIATLTDKITDMHLKQEGVAPARTLAGAVGDPDPARGAAVDRRGILQFAADSRAGRRGGGHVRC